MKADRAFVPGSGSSEKDAVVEDGGGTFLGAGPQLFSPTTPPTDDSRSRGRSQLHEYLMLLPGCIS